jgi:hypothetical protein
VPTSQHRPDINEVMGMLPCWPKHRYLEFPPKHGQATRRNLSNPVELEGDLCSFTVPPSSTAALNFAR